ncbi:hypothetical protein [Oscillatoria salina]|uniref:hypothetical protein n=1 Tax=Oscillatoria salina TaxID=331517 RepID=UPI0013B8C9C9|nr:hypothetical protein [Oscillatoria salina]MBZ8179237.1 hypothetical protein [Oscillatoria salina IIICB1]NET89559.1 hypothetical protein [Kamptonema sp. SIO1D9]
MKLRQLWQNLGIPVVYYPKLAKVTGGASAAIFLAYLINQQLFENQTEEWLSFSSQEIEMETGLSRREQEFARQQLRQRSLLKERSITTTNDSLEFYLDLDALEQRFTSFSKLLFNQDSVKNNLSNSTLDIEKNSSINQSHSTAKTQPVEVVKDTFQPNSRVKKVKTDKYFGNSRQPISVQVSPHYQFSGPWETQEQFEAFQAALLEYFKEKGLNNPSGCVFKVIDSMTKGIKSPLWDDFIQGKNLGESEKIQRDWEIEPGIPYPAFEEERIQYYIHKGEPLEAAVSKARSDLRNPVLGQDLWSGFLRKCDRLAEEAMQAKKMGVSNPYLPPSFTANSEVTKESVMKKLAAIDSQHSLSESQSAALPETSPPDIKVTKQPEIPSLESLQKAYKTPLGRQIVAKQIAENPQWGYIIVDSETIAELPF